MEHYGCLIISTLRFVWRLVPWASPVLFWHVYSGGSHGLVVRSAGLAALLFLVGHLLRAAGRGSQPLYQQFLNSLHQARTLSAGSQQTRSILAKYDFDTSYWPIDFAAKAVGPFPVFESDDGGFLMNGASFLLARMVGASLMYPGSMAFMNALLEPHLKEGRSKLIEKYGGQRFVIQTTDDNLIDTMFVDRRGSEHTPFGYTLVVTCEGNAGFYEIGSMYPALEAGYSVLGWNHPGFAGSKGEPFPSNERCAIDAVLQLANNRLSFSMDRVILYAWSIGGYTASWGAANNPRVSALVLDATFDDVVPLAVTRMPRLLSPLVRLACRRHLDLNVTAFVTQYNGPLLIIRRSRDEVITTRNGDIGSNRGNDLLVAVLRRRYPELVDSETEQELRVWLASDHSETSEERPEPDLNIDDHIRELLLDGHSGGVPSSLGKDEPFSVRVKLLLYLTGRYMVDFDQTHTAPLPSQFLRQQSWDWFSAHTHRRRDDDLKLE